MLLAQIPGSETAITAAANQGWAFGLIALILCAFMASLAWLVSAMMKQAENREARMAERINKLEDMNNMLVKEQRDTLQVILQQNQKAIDDNTAALQTMTKALLDKPCMLDAANQSNLVGRILQHLVDAALPKVEKVLANQEILLHRMQMGSGQENAGKLVK